MRTWRWMCLGIGVWLACTGVAWAQDGADGEGDPVPLAGDEVDPTSPDTQYQQLTFEARELYTAGAYDEAIAKLEAAYALKANSNILYNIGRIFETKGDIDSARRYYEEFVVAPNVDLESRKDAIERLRVFKELDAVKTKPVVDTDGDGILDDRDQCVDEAEDVDGYQDADGCPDLDNDGDTIADADDACPLEAEDMDGRDDQDGCPDLDHDGDGIAEHIDQCPLDAEDFNGYLDADGCPDGGAGPSPWGWVGLGTGLALIGTGVGLSVYGFQLRDEVQDWTSSELAPATQREAHDQLTDSDTFVVAGLVTAGVGAAATLAGALVLGTTWNSAESDAASDGGVLDPSLSGLVFSPGADGHQRLGFRLGGRF